MRVYNYDVVIRFTITRYNPLYHYNPICVIFITDTSQDSSFFAYYIYINRKSIFKYLYIHGIKILDLNAFAIPNFAAVHTY